MTSDPPAPIVLGQRTAVDLLRAALRAGHVPHAWIFHGPLGVGKSTTARELARLLLDPSTTSAHVDAFVGPRTGADAALFDAGTHPDLHVVRRELAAVSSIAELRKRKLTNIPLDLVRELVIGGRIDERPLPAPAYLTPFRGRGKVFIVEEAELLEPAAQNALLKTLEEPPPNTWIILVTTRLRDLLPTVRSRCQLAAFGPLDPASMREWASRTDSRAEPEALRWAMAMAEGSPGAALFLLRHGLADWERVVGPGLREAVGGRAVATLPDTLLGLVDGLAESIMKERRDALRSLAGGTTPEADAESEGDDDAPGEEGGEPDAIGPRVAASKVSAKREALGWLSLVMGRVLRDGLRDAIERGGDPEPWLRTLDLLPQLESMVDSNVNLRNALADFAALAASGLDARLLDAR